MAHQKKHRGAVPLGNQSKSGRAHQTDNAETPHGNEVESNQEQDPKRRLGDFDGKGEHSMQEPGSKKDANH
jgi:hypothetical protein